MSLTEQQVRLWHALDIGPRWQERHAVAFAHVPESSGEPAVEQMPSSVAPAVVMAPTRDLDWDALRQQVAGCQACDLCQSRQQTVFSAGQVNAPWMFIGEAPGAEEDARGEPFVGQAGRLLDNIFQAMGLNRQPQAGSGQAGVCIANVLKCRPPGNRNPDPLEVQRCLPFLQRQIQLVNPDILVVLGRFAAQAILGTEASIASLRGKVHHIDLNGRQVPVVVTYHPAYLLRTPSEKSRVWEDLCLALDTVTAAD